MHNIKRFVSKNFIFLKSKLDLSRYIIIIFLIALFLRLLGVYPGFPPNHPDEPTIYGSVKQLFLYGEFKPVLYSYGGLLYELYSLVIFVLLIPFSFLIFFFSHLNEIALKGIFGFVESYRHSQLLSGLNFLYWSRYLTSVLGALTVIVIYKLGTKLFNRWTGLLAAFFVAINYRLVLSSIFTLADAPAGFFAALSILLSVYVIKKRSLSAYLWAGFGLAMALSVKYFVYVVPTFFLCHILLVFQESNLSFFKKIKALFINKNLILSLFLCVVLFFVINPYIILDFNNFIKEYQYDAKRFGVTAPIQQLLNYSYHRSVLPLYYLVKYSLGEPLAIAIVVGFLYTLIRKFRSALILSSAIIPFLVVFLAIAAPSSPRYYSAIVPLMLFFPAFLIIDVSRIIRSRPIRFVLIFSLVIIVGFQSLRDSYLTSLYFSSEQNQVASLRWLEDNLPRESIVAVSAAFLPLTKNLIEIDINPVGPTHLMSMEELVINQVQWVVVSSHFTSSVNSQLWIGSNLVEKAFFNDKLFWELIDNTYTSLVLNEVGAYRIKEFVKPFWQSPDRAIIIAKMPNFWQIRKDKSVIYYGFDRAKDKSFSKISFTKQKKPASFTEDIGYIKPGSLSLQTNDCSAETKLSSDNFLVESNKWYSAIGFGKRENNPTYSGYKDGFLRLDFYSKNNTKLRTYVSKLLMVDDNWQEQTLAGFAPANSKYARISFQLDKCFPGEKYFIDDLQVFSSDNMGRIDTKEYPFYDKEVPKNLLWLPEL